MNLVKKIARSEQVEKVLESIEAMVNEAMTLAIAVQQIPAPTFDEEKRATFIEGQFNAAGLADVSQDPIHNVYGRRPGTGHGPAIVISAHSDTVFPADTDLGVRFENGQQNGKGLIYGPGLADNSLGIAGLLWLVSTMDRFRLETSADIWFVANVGEEGLGNLLGMRTVVKRFGRSASYIVVEGGSFGHIFHRAIGVRRFKIDVNTPGGHSWGDFGRPSAVHSLSKLIAAMEELPVQENPKTSYNVGVISGGTSINTIAQSASCLLDLRSTNYSALQEIELSVRDLVGKANQVPEVAVTMELIGDRPPGEIPRSAELVSWAAESLRQVGWQQISFMAGSTDANLPISMGLPAICIGLAHSGNTHRLDEFVDPSQLPKGLGQLLLLTLAAAGYDR